jgi:hypothetical protein
MQIISSNLCQRKITNLAELLYYDWANKSHIKLNCDGLNYFMYHNFLFSCESESSYLSRALIAYNKCKKDILLIAVSLLEL